MPLISINEVGQFGLLPDLPAHELPFNAWESGENVRFLNGFAQKINGYKEMFDVPAIVPYFTTFVRNAAGEQYWIYAGSVAVWVWEATGGAASTHNNITRSTGAYTSAGALNWHGGILNGVVVLNNGIDPPQMWNPVQANTLLTTLANWPANTTAAIMRSYKNFLIALDVTKAGVRDPRLVKWSHAASAGAVPTSWNEADATKDAGEYSLADTEGALIDCLPLRDSNILYKDDSIWLMEHVSGQSIFRFAPLFRNAGIFAKNCVVEYQIGKHLVFGRDMVFVHDGQTIVPITLGKVQDWLYSNIDAEHANTCFVTLNSANNEVWICFPEISQSLPTKALIWNWDTGAFGAMELPRVSSIGRGMLLEQPSAGDAWNSDATTWEIVGNWGAPSSTTAPLNRLLMAVPGSVKLYGVFEDLLDFNGVDFVCSLERRGLGIPFKVGKAPDIASIKLCTNIWPRITGTLGDVVQIRFGVQQHIGDTVIWGAWKDFKIGTTKKIDVLASGRLFALGFRSTNKAKWKLQGYDLDVQFLGVN